MIRGAILLCMVLAVALGARSFLPADADITGSGATLAVGVMLLAALQAGHVTEAIRLPHVTAYILAGILIGPDGMGLVTPTMLEDLGIVKSVAVGLIALLAGCELNLRALAPRLREIALLSVSGPTTAFLVLFLLLYGVSFLLPFGQDLSPVARAMVAVVCANAMCAFSPPVVIGILTEARAKGPMSELWISIAVLADIAIVLTFSLTSAVAHLVLGGSSDGGALLSVVGHILGSLLVGAIIGPLLALYIVRVGKRVGLFVFAALFVIAQAGVPLHLDRCSSG